MTLLGTKSEERSRRNDETGEIEKWRVALVLFAKCDNEPCLNFTTRHDLAGSWCCDECIISSEERR